MFCKTQFKILNSTWINILAHQKLLDFEAVWNIKSKPFEPINQRRGGYSGVYQITLQDEQGSAKNIFLKRQKNHNTGFFLISIPTFYREYKILKKLSQLKIPVVQWLVFGCTGKRAILIVEALDGYLSLDKIPFVDYDIKEQQLLLKSIALTLSQLHQHNIKFGACYPKHLFLRKQENHYDCKLIDLEKAKTVLFKEKAIIADFDQLIRRDEQMTTENIEYLLTAYCQFMGQKWRVNKLLKKINRKVLKK